MTTKQNTKHPAVMVGSDMARKFEFTAPEAKSVKLVGDFTLWEEQPISLHKSGDGIWRAVVPLGAGTHRYRFLVDGRWSDDPHCSKHVPNPFGGHDSVCIVA